MFYDPRSEPHGLPHNPWNALVSPRPIGWISTLSADGIANLAPYSFFNAVAGNPPFVMFSSTPRKHSLANIEATGEFAVNVATWDLRLQMNQSSAIYPPEVDEFEMVGLAKAHCRNIRAPRVAAAPAAIECILYQTIPLKPKSGLPSSTTIIIGEVVGIHIDDAILTDGRVDSARMRPLARLGYMDYSVTDKIFEMLRPVLDPADRKANADHR
jgi:flavin reductase (DIM6/NTAB) family NADH-FMN oxidoreductase RutF